MDGVNIPRKMCGVTIVALYIPWLLYRYREPKFQLASDTDDSSSVLLSIGNRCKQTTENVRVSYKYNVLLYSMHDILSNTPWQGSR